MKVVIDDDEEIPIRKRLVKGKLIVEEEDLWKTQVEIRGLSRPTFFQWKIDETFDTFEFLLKRISNEFEIEKEGIVILLYFPDESLVVPSNDEKVNRWMKDQNSCKIVAEVLDKESSILEEEAIQKKADRYSKERERRPACNFVKETNGSYHDERDYDSESDEGDFINDEEEEPMSESEEEESEEELNEVDSVIEDIQSKELEEEDLSLIKKSRKRLRRIEESDSDEESNSDEENLLETKWKKRDKNRVEEDESSLQKALHRACSNDQVEETLEILRSYGKKTRINYVNERDVGGMTALMAAAGNGAFNCVRLLLNLGADPDLKDDANANVLHFASQGSFQILSFLLERCKYDYTSRDEDRSTPFHMAAWKGSIECMEEILKVDSSHIQTTNRNLWNCLHFAAFGGQSQSLDWLLKQPRCPNPNNQSRVGETPLHLCSINGNEECVKRLLKENNIDPLLCDDSNWPPLFYASFERHWEVVKILVRSGVKQIHLLGDLAKERRLKLQAEEVLKVIAEEPSCYQIFNEAIRTRPHILNGELKFLQNKTQLLDFNNKIAVFRKENQVNQRTTIQVERTSAFEDVRAIFYNGLLEGELLGGFVGEEGSGPGVRREFFHLLSSHLILPEEFLFKPTTNGDYEPSRLEEPNESKWEFAGYIVGQMLLQNNRLPFRLAKYFLKRILGVEVNISDLEVIEPEVFNSMNWILENEVEGMEMTFSTDVKDDSTGTSRTVPVVKRGEFKSVNSSNKKKFVDALVDFKLNKSIKAELEAFKSGLNEVIQISTLSYFRDDELDLLLSGVSEINVEEWRSKTTYFRYLEGDAVIQWFWETVHSMKQEERALLLKFATGSSVMPSAAFQPPFAIHEGDLGKEGNRLPSASTCFNMLKLPRYASKELLEKSLLIAVRYGSSGFTFS